MMWIKNTTQRKPNDKFIISGERPLSSYIDGIGKSVVAYHPIRKNE